MFNNCGGRMRELSIYSILTIIVLISISGGSETRGETKVINSQDDAALLVTEDFLHERARWYETIYKNGIGKKRITKEYGNDPVYLDPNEFSDTRELNVMEIRVDGKEYHRVFSEGRDLSEKGLFEHGWMEISPGFHDFCLSIYWSDYLPYDAKSGEKSCKQGTHHETIPSGLIGLNIRPHGVYVITSRIKHKTKNQNCDFESPDRIHIEIAETINEYNQNQGVVSDPTDSKFSFRIKK